MSICFYSCKHYSYDINHTFAFTTKGLISQFIFPLAQEYVETALLHGQDADNDIECLLDQCYSVGRHTNIIWIRPNKTPIRYAWTEPVVRPWGQTLPYQCPKCMSPFPWDRGTTNEKTKDIVFRCKGYTAKKRRCENSLTITNIYQLDLVARGNKGKWKKGNL